MSSESSPSRHSPSAYQALPEIITRQLKLNLAQQVADARHHAGLTQLELAQLAELSRGTVHLIEAGLCDSRLSTIARLARALEVDALRLLAPMDHQSDGGESASNNQK